MSQVTINTPGSDASSGPTDSLPVVAGKFLLPSAVGTVVWLTFVAWITNVDPTVVGTMDARSIIGMSIAVLSVLAPVWIYRTAPREYVDRYHSLGVQLSMFVSVNVIITTAILGYWIAGQLLPLGGLSTQTPLTPSNAIVLVIASSILLPGPYVGALIGRYWSD